jgi:endoglucanase
MHRVTCPTFTGASVIFRSCLGAAILLYGLLVCAGVPGYCSENDAVSHNRLLGRGINLGNALEAPTEGEWGVTIKPEYFRIIREAGFNSVRIPIRWSAHAGLQPPYVIAEKFYDRIDEVVRQALDNDLVVVLDLHHYYEMMANPEQHVSRLISLWTQISAHYRSYSDRLYFELLNEPYDNLSDDKWNRVLLDILHAVRKTNPTRTVIIGPGYWNSLDHLSTLTLPEDDRNIIVTFHYYLPIQFTFQGSEYPGSDKWRGTTWADTASERSLIERNFDKAAAWSRQKQRPLYLGEFGANQSADMQSRESWTRAVVEESQKRGFSWSYWEFCYHYGAYDPAAMTWREPLLKALTDSHN